jgi:hypothetical protein
MIKKKNILIGLVKMTNALLDGLLQGGMVGMGVKGFRVKEQEQEKKLFNPALRNIELFAMTPHPTLVRFLKAFVLHYPKLLLFKQEYSNVKVPSWVTG